jgi:hypothetical protein
MSGAQIALEVAAALREVGGEVGEGPLVVTLAPAPIGGNPWDDPSAAPATVELVAVMSEFRNSEIDGARIRSGDKKLMIEAGVAVPKAGDGLTVEGVAHRVEEVWPLSPAGTDLMYTVQARRV